jgi:DNA-binding NarL/FixJ family response regulator
MSIRVLLVDDQALIRTGFRMILDAEGDIEVVGESATGAQAVDSVKRLKPHVVLMDIRMPEMDGIEATRRIVALGGEGDEPVRVLMLTTFDLDEYVYDALRVGASGFLLKDVPADQLVNGIRLVATGEALLAPSVTRRLISEFSKVAPAAAKPPPALDELTERELEVLKLMGPRAFQRRDRRRARRLEHDRQDARGPCAAEARPARPRPGRGPGVRVRPRDPGPVLAPSRLASRHRRGRFGEQRRDGGIARNALWSGRDTTRTPHTSRGFARGDRAIPEPVRPLTRHTLERRMTTTAHGDQV